RHHGRGTEDQRQGHRTVLTRRPVALDEHDVAGVPPRPRRRPRRVPGGLRGQAELLVAPGRDGHAHQGAGSGDGQRFRQGLLVEGHRRAEGDREEVLLHHGPGQHRGQGVDRHRRRTDRQGHREPARRVQGRRLPQVRLRRLQQGQGVRAVVGPGPVPHGRRGVAGQHRQALPAVDLTAAVDRQHERGHRQMTSLAPPVVQERARVITPGQGGRTGRVTWMALPALGVFLAGHQRYREILAVLFFIPLLLSSAAIAITYKALLDPNFGLGAGLHIPLLTQDWLGKGPLALGVVIFVVSWQYIPFHTLIYQGGVRQIPRTMYEAAQIDGAGRMRSFFSITLPQLKYTIVTSSTLMVVGSLTFFDLIFVLTAGGPGDATRLLALDMYKRGFQANLMGPA